MRAQEATEQQVNPLKARDDIVWFPQVISTLPFGWYIVRLGDVVDVKGGKRLPKRVGFAEDPTAYPYIRIVDFANGSVKTNGLKYLAAEVQQQISRYIIHKEDVYISIAGTIGIVGTIPNELDGANLTENAAKLVIKVRDELDKEYLANYLNGEGGQTQIENLTTKTTQPKLALTRIEQIRIPLPPIKEQLAIAQILKTVQEAIQTRRDELGLERERKAALIEYLFAQGTRGETTKQTKIGEIPGSWRIVGLREICGICYGLGQPPTLDDNGVPMIRATDIKSGRIVSSTVVRVKRQAIPEKRNPFLKRGDIIVVRSGAYTGDVAMYDGRWDLAIAGYDLVVTPVSDEIDMAFIAQYLLGNAVQAYFRSQRDRSAQPHLNADQLSNTIIPLPTLTEQFEISNVLNACDDKIASLEQELSLLEELFKTLLEELMSGRLSTLPLIEEGETHD